VGHCIAPLQAFDEAMNSLLFNLQARQDLQILGKYFIANDQLQSSLVSP
jgi:hypothetical protein